MKTKIKFLATMLIGILLSTNVWGADASLVINTSNFTKTKSGDGYAVYNGTHTISGIDIYSNQVMVNAGNVQFEGSHGILYNTTEMPGPITRIDLSYSNGNVLLYAGTAQNPSSSPDNKVFSGNTITGDKRWFTAKVSGGSTGTCSAITVYYQACDNTLATPSVTAVPGNQQVTLSWANIPNASKYQVAWNGGSFADATSPLVKTGLTNNTTYTWSVKAIGDGTTYCDSETADGSSTPSTAHNITYYIGNVSATIPVAEGANLVASLPQSPESCDPTGSNVFMGWTTSPIDDVVQEAPTMVASSATVTGPGTYYAVFAQAGGGGGGVPTAAFSVGDEGDYVIAAYDTYDSKWYALPANQSGTKIQGIEINVSTTAGGIKYVAEGESSGKVWTFAKSGNYYTLFDGTNYIYHSNGGASGTDLAQGNTSTYLWSLSVDDNDNSKIVFAAVSGNPLAVKTRGLGFQNYTTNKEVKTATTQFGGYSLGNLSNADYSKISVLPIAGGTTYSNYRTSCAPCETEVAITKGPETYGTFMLSRSGENVCIDNDATIIVSNINPAEHYSVSEVTTTNGTVTGPTDGKYTVTVTGDATIGVTFVEDAKALVTWKVGGTMVKEELVYVGQTTTAPADPTDMPSCANTFMGWSTETLVGEGNDAPDDLFSTTSPAITEDVTFNAVFAQAESAVDPSPVTIWSENFGSTITANMDWSEDYDGFSGKGLLTYGVSGTTVKISKNSSGKSGCSLYTTGAGEGHFTVSGLDTRNYTNLQLTYYVYSTSGATRYGKVTIDGVDYSGGTTTASSWSEMTCNTIPSKENLSITFTFGASNANGKFDEITLTGTLGTTYSNYVTSCAVYTVTFKSNGQEVTHVDNVVPGQKVTAPTLGEIQTSAACSKYLIGWSNKSVYRDSSTAPNDLQKPDAEGKITVPSDITGDVTYHAVYADVAGE